MGKLYRTLLQKLCRRERKKIANQYPAISREELVQYYDYMMLECVNEDTPAKSRILGISLVTVKMLETKP